MAHLYVRNKKRHISRYYLPYVIPLTSILTTLTNPGTIINKPSQNLCIDKRNFPRKRYLKYYLAGADITFDTNAQIVKSHTLALKSQSKKLDMLATVKDFSIFNGYLYQKINNRTDLGVHINFNKNTNRSKFAIAGKYKISNDNHSFVKAKINQDYLINLAYGCNINDGGLLLADLCY